MLRAALGRRLRGLLFSSRPRWLMMPSHVAEGFVDTLLFTVSVLDRHDVQHIAHFGTLLGAVRLGGVCPWDEDADIAIVGEDLPSLEAKVRTDLEAHGYRLIPDERGFFWVRRHPWWAGQGHLALELLPPTAEDGSSEPKTTWEAFVPERQLFPLRRYPFHGSWVWGPALAEELLERLYGETGRVKAMARHRAPRVSAECQAFWRSARGEALHWEAISERFRRLTAERPYAHVRTFPWWWFNGAWNLGIGKLRRLGERLQR